MTANNEIDRSRYTQDELGRLAYAGKLPGYLSTTEFGPHLVDGSAWQPVLNASIMWVDNGLARASDALLYILTTIRRRETNSTHPDVVSTPTKRTNQHDVRTLLAEKEIFRRPPAHPTFMLTDVDPARPVTIASFRPNLQRLAVPSNAVETPNKGMLSKLTTGLLAKKLGYEPSGPRELNFIGTLGLTSLSKIVLGFSYVDDAKDGAARFEPIMMIGSVFSTGMVEPVIPTETQDYRNISWTIQGSFANNVAERNVGRLVVASEWDEVYACVRGLCLATSVESTADLEDIWSHLGYSPDGFGFRSYFDPSIQRNTHMP